MSLELVVGGHYLALMTSWGDLDWSLCWPGYSDELTFDVASHPSTLRPDAPVALVWAGEKLWSGTLDEPVRGQRLRAAGLFRKGEQYAALNGGGNLSLYPNEAVDVAIGRGMPWTNPTGGLVGPVPLGTDAPSTVAEVLAAMDAQTPSWATGIAPSGQLIRRERSAPRLHIRPGGDGLGIAWDNYASTLIARYVDSTTHLYTTVIRSDATAEARWGYRERTVSSALNDGAEMTLTQAQAVLDSMLASGRSRPGWTTPVEVEYGGVVTERQQPVDLATIRPYETVRVHGLTDDVGDLAGQSYVDMPLARIQHQRTSVVLTPVGLVSPMQDVLTGKTAA